MALFDICDAVSLNDENIQINFLKKTIYHNHIIGVCQVHEIRTLLATN